MINKNSFLRIPALKLTGKIENMTDKPLTEYIQSVNSFIDEFPSLSEKISNALGTKAYDDARKYLTDVSMVLIRIHADDLAAECRMIVNSLVGNVDHDAAEASVENFSQSVSTLSIDVQMAMRDTDAEAAPQNPRPAPVTPAASDSSRPLILAVDNAIMFLNTLKRLLQDAPYDLECVSSGAKALEYLNENPPPQLLMLDIEMPIMDGYELAKKIKQNGINVPILFITANAGREYVIRAVEIGAVWLLVKPLRSAQLIAKLKELI